MSKTKDKKKRIEKVQKKTEPQPQEARNASSSGLNIPFELVPKQKEVFKSVFKDRDKCVIIDGMAGTSKTWLAVFCAARLALEGSIEHIIYLRAPIEAGSAKLGHLPGTQEEKMQPYLEPLFDKLSEIIGGKQRIDAVLKGVKLEGMPTGFVRGRNWKNACVIVDEAQNMTYDELILLASRCAEGTTIFFIGDSELQNDLGLKSGFLKFIRVIHGVNPDESKDNGVSFFEFKDEEDIVRSGFVRFILNRYRKQAVEDKVAKEIRARVKKENEPKPDISLKSGKDWSPSDN